MSASGNKTKLVTVLAGLLAAAGAIVALGLRRPERVEPPKNGGKPPPAARSAALEGLVARLPASTVLLAATDDLAALRNEFKRGPLGRTLLAPGCAKFRKALARGTGGRAGELVLALKAGLLLAGYADGPAALGLWELAGERGQTLGFAARVKPEKADRCLEALGRILAAPGEEARRVPGAADERLRTLAPEGRQGTSWGVRGRWTALADTLGGCRELLAAVSSEPPRGAAGLPARERMEKALAAAGPGRLVVFCRAEGLVPARFAAAVGLGSAEWVAGSASADAAGRWSERLVIGGAKSREPGLAAGLAPGGERPVLAGLPGSALACVTFNVSDGPRLWTEIRKLDPGGGLDYLARLLADAGDKDFEREVAPLARGETTASWSLPRQGLFPQVLWGTALAPGGAKKLEPGAHGVLGIRWLGAGGEVTSAEYLGVKMTWLTGQTLVKPLTPSPCYAFPGDRLLAASSTLPLKEFLAGRGKKWLEAAAVERLSAGLIGCRVSLERAAVFLWGLATQLGGWNFLGEELKGSLPLCEDVADHAGELEIVVSRCPAGLRIEVRAPLPLAASALAALLTFAPED